MEFDDYLFFLILAMMPFTLIVNATATNQKSAIFIFALSLLAVTTAFVTREMFIPEEEWMRVDLVILIPACFCWAIVLVVIFAVTINRIKNRDGSAK